MEDTSNSGHHFLQCGVLTFIDFKKEFVFLSTTFLLCTLPKKLRAALF